MHGLEVRAEGAEARLDRVDALAPVRADPDAEPPLDTVVVRIEVGRAERRAARADEPARVVPLRVVLVARPQRDLRVDRRRAADAPRREERDEPSGAAVDRREPERPPEVVVGLRLPAREVRGGAVGPGLEQKHLAPAVGELAGDDAAACPRSDHDDIEALARAHCSGAGEAGTSARGGSVEATPPIPRYDQSFFSRVASGVEKSISSHAPGASSPGATKSL